MDDRTAIKVSVQTWKRINRRKEPGESFDETLRRILDEVEDDEPLPPGCH